MAFDLYGDRFREGGLGSGDYAHSGRKGFVGGSTAGSVPATAAAGIHEHGGITISIHGSIPTKGYAVAGLKDASGTKVEKVFANRVTTREVAMYMKNNASVLARDHVYLGAWIEKGKTYLDVSEVHSDRSAALAQAHQRDEIAVFDLGKFENVYTMSDEHRPSESSGKKMKETAEAKAYNRKMRMFFGKDQTPEQIAKAINAAREAIK